MKKITNAGRYWVKESRHSEIVSDENCYLSYRRSTRVIAESFHHACVCQWAWLTASTAPHGGVYEQTDQTNNLHNQSWCFLFQEGLLFLLFLSIMLTSRNTRFKQQQMTMFYRSLCCSKWLSCKHHSVPPIQYLFVSFEARTRRTDSGPKLKLLLFTWRPMPFELSFRDPNT